jgi:hypothetical protein
VEIGLGLYFTYVNYYAWSLGIYGVMPFLCLFQFGYFYTGLGSLVQALKRMDLPWLRIPLPFRWVPEKEELAPKPKKA